MKYSVICKKSFQQWNNFREALFGDMEAALRLEPNFPVYCALAGLLRDIAEEDIGCAKVIEQFSE